MEVVVDGVPRHRAHSTYLQVGVGGCGVFFGTVFHYGSKTSSAERSMNKFVWWHRFPFSVGSVDLDTTGRVRYPHWFCPAV